MSIKVDTDGSKLSVLSNFTETKYTSVIRQMSEADFGYAKFPSTRNLLKPYISL